MSGPIVDPVSGRSTKPALLLGTCTLLLTLGGCTPIMKQLYGLNSFNKNATPEQQVAESKKLDVYQEGFVLDTSYGRAVFTAKWTSDVLQHALLQPLQVRIYDRKGVLLDVMPNCNVPPGLSNLHWEDTHVFDSLPDRRARSVDTTITLANDARFLRRLTDGTTATMVPQKQHTILVFWTYMMGRQSKRLVELARDAQARHRDDYDLYFVVADNLYH